MIRLSGTPIAHCLYHLMFNGSLEKIFAVSIMSFVAPSTLMTCATYATFCESFVNELNNGTKRLVFWVTGESCACILCRC